MNINPIRNDLVNSVNKAKLKKARKTSPKVNEKITKSRLDIVKQSNFNRQAQTRNFLGAHQG